MHLDIHVVVHGDTQPLARCLESVTHATESLDTTVRVAAHDVTAPINIDGIDVFTRENDGFGAGHNFLAQHGNSEYILCINQDITIVSGQIAQLIEWMNHHPALGVIGCYQRFPNGPRIDSQGQSMNGRHMLIQSLGSSKPNNNIRGGVFVTDDNQYHAEQECSWINGSFMLIRRIAFEAVGGFDNDYFLFFDEVDMQRRMQEQGWKIGYSPCVHVERTPSPRSAHLNLIHRQSALRYMDTWMGPIERVTAWLSLFIHDLRHSPQQLKQTLLHIKRVHPRRKPLVHGARRNGHPRFHYRRV